MVDAPLVTLPHDLLAHVAASLWRHDVSSLRMAHRAFACLQLPGLCPSSMRELSDMLATAEEGTLIDLGGRTLDGTLDGTLDKPLSINTPGVTLRDGTLQLTSRGCLRLMADGARLEALTVLGWACWPSSAQVPVVGGARGVALKGCTFTNIGVCVANNAAVEMSSCLVSGVGIGCEIGGARSRLAMQGCKVHDVEYGVWVYGGAAVLLDACDVSGRVNAACVEGKGSVLQHVGSTLNGGSVLQQAGGRVVAADNEIV